MSTRQTWSSRLTYILTVAGATIGFGATWRFPYLVGENGGGAYVLTFIAVMMLVGIPIILVENVIGRRAQANSVDAFALAGRAPGYSPSPLWKLFGYTGLLGAFGILAYYMVIGGWVISYIWHIFLGAAGVAGGLDLSSPITKELTESFYSDTIEHSPFAITCYTLVFVLINWVILRKGVIQGIERSVKYLMPLLLLCLLIMVIRNLTLDDAAAGVSFYLTPDFSKITPRLFLDVLGQVFFALSLGFGVMITLSSHLNQKEDMVKTAVITGIINTLVAVMAGFMIFPSLFSANLAPDSGPSLVFKSLPIAFSEMFLGNFFAIVFFLLLVIAALTTSLTIYQAHQPGPRHQSDAWRHLPVRQSALHSCLWSVARRTHSRSQHFRCVRLCERQHLLCDHSTRRHHFRGLDYEKQRQGRNRQLRYAAGLWFVWVRYVIPVVIIAIFAYGLRGFFA